jgi:hypothetical protein
MMDYYSNFPAPSKEDAIKEVVQACKIKLNLDKKILINMVTEETIKDYNIKVAIDEKILVDTVSDVIHEMPSLGSYTGWYASFKGDAINMVLKKLEIKKNE